MYQNFIRSYILKDYYEFYDLITYFCAFEYWTTVISRNNFKFLHELYDKFHECFDFKFWAVKLHESVQHLSLFCTS